MFGIKRVSDEEFVEQQRKLLRIGKWFGWFGLSMVVAVYLVVFWGGKSLLGFAEGLSDHDASKLYFYGLLTGFGLAWGAAMTFIWGIVAVARGFDWLGLNRGLHLLIRYHDALKEVAPSVRVEPTDRGECPPDESST